MILLDLEARPIIAHRGASGLWPENTLRAFREGLDQGADALEFDVRLTRDGIPVVIHDESVDRTTQGSGLVQNFLCAALQELDAGQGECIPRLATVLEAFPEVPLIIEVKEARASQAVAEVVLSMDAARRVVIGAFQHAALRPFQQEVFYRAASRREIALFLAATRLRMPTLGKGGYACFSVPERKGRIRIVDEQMVQRARRLQQPVHVWTVDRPEDARRLWDLGVSGILTNYPDRMVALRDGLGNR